MDERERKRAYQRGYNLINGAALIYPRSALDIITRYQAEPDELKHAFLRGVEAAERRRDRELLSQWEEGRKWLRLLSRTERAMARCWALNAKLGLGGLFDATTQNGAVAARTEDLKAVIKRLVDSRLLDREVLEGL